MDKNIQTYQKFYEYFSVLFKEDELETKTIRKLFLLSLQDFINKKIDEVTFSSITNDLYYVFSSPKNYENSNTLQELGNSLSDATELDYYFFNKNADIANTKIYKGILANLKKYFVENKHLINDKS